VELQQSVERYIEQHNLKPKPYIWTAQAKDILEKVKRAWYALKARGFNKVTRALESIERCLAAEPEAATCSS
jgi:hypothetical protein